MFSFTADQLSHWFSSLSWITVFSTLVNPVDGFLRNQVCRPAFWVPGYPFRGKTISSSRVFSIAYISDHSIHFAILKVPFPQGWISNGIMFEREAVRPACRRF